MATKDQVRGIQAKRKKPVVVPVDDDPENQFLSKKQFLEKRKRQKEAKAAAEAAYQRTLRGEREAQNAEEPTQSEEPKPSDDLKPLRKKLATAERALAKRKTKANEAKVAALTAELEEAGG